MAEDASKTPGSQDKPFNELTSTVVFPSSQFSVAIQDLLQDELLKDVKRITFEKRTVPALGGIPLLAKLGQGGMGAVYFGYKPMLKQEVAIKVLPAHMAKQHNVLVERFLREAQVASKVESPHLVRVTDVNEEGGLYYLVMEFVNGNTAGEYRRSLQQQVLDEATALDICIAATAGLAAAHAQGIVHRDIKPDNIMIPRVKGTDQYLFNASKLSDLGLARAEDSQGGPTLTGQQASMGTPGYMAPEQALNARKAGKPADVFSMGATLYALLGGSSPFKGETTNETVFATLQKPHQPIRELRKDISKVTAELIDTCLQKDPTKRYACANGLFHALKVCRENAAAAEPAQLKAIQALGDLQKASEVGLAARASDSGATPPPALPGITPLPVTPAPPSGHMRPRTVAILMVLALIIGGAVWEITHLAGQHDDKERGGAHAETRTKIGFVYGYEKEAWMRWAVDEFNQLPDNKYYEIEGTAMPAGDVEALLSKEDQRFQVWSPANSLDADIFQEKWTKKYNKDPFDLGENDLALSPMVFVMFKDRYDAFIAKYKTLDFTSLQLAMKEKADWNTIANRPDWGVFSFGIADPIHNAIGKSSVLLMAHHFYKREAPLTAQELNAPEFLEWAKVFTPAFVARGKAFDGAKNMALKGPSSFDVILTYEASVIDNMIGMTNQGEIHVEYPKINIWNDNPYYILDVPWVTKNQKEGAKYFLDFLHDNLAQKKAMEGGYRPGNTKIALTADHVLRKDKTIGFRIPVPITVEDPPPERVRMLMDHIRAWEQEIEAVDKTAKGTGGRP
ncbi:MAG: protein kinase [Planctomycetes bacterium]|nr:protein kinase [Planctomycetota bacterium]